MAKSLKAERPPPPGPAPTEGDVPLGPHPLNHADERKEGGPDFGKGAGQEERRDRAVTDAAGDSHPRLKRKPRSAP